MTKVQNTNVSAATQVENKKVKKQQQKKEQQVFKGNGNKQTVQKPNDSALKQEIYKKTGFQLKDTKNRGQIINLKVNGRVRPYETVGTLTTGGRILVKEIGKEVYHVVSHTPDKKPVMLKDDYARNKVFYETTSAEHKVKIGKKNYIITNSKRDRHGRMTAINSRGQEVILSHDGKELKRGYVEAEDQKDNMNDYIAKQTKGKSKAEADKIRQQILSGNSSYSNKGVLRFKASNGEVWYYDTKRKTYVKYAEKEAQAIIKNLDKGAKENWLLFRTGLGTDYELLKNTNAQIIDPEVLNKVNKHYSAEYGNKVDKNAQYGSGKYKTAYEAFLASEIGDDEVYLFNAALVKNNAITDQSRRNEILQTNLTKISGFGVEGLGVGVNKRANRMAAADAASTKEDYQALQDAAEEENKKKNYKAQFKGQDALQTYIYGVHDGDVQEIDDFNTTLIDPKEDMLDRDEIVRIKAETGVLWAKKGLYNKAFESQDSDVTKQMFALQSPNGKSALDAKLLKKQVAEKHQDDYLMMARLDLYSEDEIAEEVVKMLQGALASFKSAEDLSGLGVIRTDDTALQLQASTTRDFTTAENLISRAYSLISNNSILSKVKAKMGDDFNVLMKKEDAHFKTNSFKNVTSITDKQVTEYSDKEGKVKLTPEQIAHNKYVVTWLKSQLADLERDKKLNEAKDGWKQDFVNWHRETYSGYATRSSVANKYQLIKSNIARLEAAAEGKLVDASGKPVSFEDAMKNLGETGIQALEYANADYQTAQQTGEFMLDMAVLALPLPKGFNAANTVIKMGNVLYKVISKSDKACKVIKITQEAAKGSKIYEVVTNVATKNPKIVENARKVATIMDSSATGAMHMAGKTVVLEASNIATSREGFTSDRISEMNQKTQSAAVFGGMGGAIGGTTAVASEFVSSAGAKYTVHGVGLVADLMGAAGLMTAESHGETNFWDNLRCVNPDGSFNFEQATMTAMMIYGHLHGASTVRGKSKAQVFDEITTNNDLQLRYQKGNEGSYEYFNAEALKWEPTTKEFFNERVARDGVKREAHSVKLENRELRLDNDGIWSDAESGRKFRLAKDNNGRTQLAELTKKEIYNSRQKTEVKDGMTLEDFRQELKNNDLRGNVYTKADGGRLVVVKHSFNKYELYEFDTNNKMISQKSVKGKSAIKESYPEFANVESSGTIGSTSGYLGMNNPVGNGNNTKKVGTLQDTIDKKELTALRNELGIKQTQKGSRFEYVPWADGSSGFIYEKRGNDTVTSYYVVRNAEGKAYIQQKFLLEKGKAIDAESYKADGSVIEDKRVKQLALENTNKIIQQEILGKIQKEMTLDECKKLSKQYDNIELNELNNGAYEVKFDFATWGKDMGGPEKSFYERLDAMASLDKEIGVVTAVHNKTGQVIKLNIKYQLGNSRDIEYNNAGKKTKETVKDAEGKITGVFDGDGKPLEIPNEVKEEVKQTGSEVSAEESHVAPKTEQESVIASEGEAIQTKQKPASAEVPKATPEQVAQVMNSLTVFSSDQGARLAFVGKHSTECANIAKKDLIYTVDEGKSVKYFPDKDISLIDESAITKEDSGRIGTFRIAVKGRVSEADAKALMEHLFDKGVIKRDADGRLLTKSVLINGNNEKLGEAISEFLANKKLNSQNPIGHSERVSGIEQQVKHTVVEESRVTSKSPTEKSVTEKPATEKPAETKTEPKTESNKPAETDPTSHSEAPAEESQAKKTPVTEERKPVVENKGEGVTPVQQTKAQQLELERLQTLVQSNEGKAILADAMKDPNFGKTAEERVPSDKIVRDADGNIQSIEIDGVTYTRNEQGKYVNGNSTAVVIVDPKTGYVITGSPDKVVVINQNKITTIKSKDGVNVDYDTTTGQPERVSSLGNTIYLSTGNSSQNSGRVTVDPVGRVIRNEVSIDIEGRRYEPYFSEGNRYSDWNKDTNGQAITLELRQKTRSDLSKQIEDAQLENRGLRTTKKGRQKAYDDLRNQIEDAYNNNKISREDADNLHAELNEKAKANGLETQETPTMKAEREALAKWNEQVDALKNNLMSEIEKVNSQATHDQMVEKIGEICKNGEIDMKRVNELYDALEAKAKSLDGVETLSQKKAKIEKQVREIETAQRIEAAEAKSRHHAELLDEYLAESGENLSSEIGSKEYYDEALSTIDRGVKNGSIEPQKAEILRTQLKEQLAKLESESNQPVTEPPATPKTENPVNASEGEEIKSPFEITADKFVVNGNEQPIPTFEEAQRTLKKYGGNQYSIETGDGNRLIFRYDDNGKFIGSREEISINGKALKDTSRNADGTLDKTIDYFHTNDGEPVLIERDSNGKPTKIKWWKRNITFDKEGKASYEVTNEKNETINKPIEEVLKDSPELKPLFEKQGIKLVEESNSPVPPVVENKGEETPAPENSGEGSTPQKTPATAIEDKYPNVPKIEEVETNEGLQLRHKVGDENSYEFFEPEVLKWEPTTKEFFEKMTSRDGVKSKATYQNIKNADGSTVQRFIDANGKKVKKIFRNKDGKITGSKEYVYDADGKMSKKISKNKDDKVSISTEYKYNEFGKESEVINKDGNGNVIYSEEYKYDKSGNQIEFINKDENGNITNSTEYKYNESGKKSEIINKDKDGNLVDSTVFKYDANGKMSLEYKKDSKGEIVSSEEYKYNADGELSKTITHDKDGNITIIYDNEQGRLLSPEETNNYIKKSLENDINNIKTKENVDEYIAELGEALEKKIITDEEYHALVEKAGEKLKAEEAVQIHADEVAEANNGEGQSVIIIGPENTPDGFPKAPSKPKQLEKKTIEEILGDEQAPKTADEAKEYAKAHEEAEFVVDKDPNNCNKLFLDKKQNNIVFYNKDGTINSYREISPSKGVRRRDTVLNPDGTVKSVKTRATNGDLKVEYYEKGNLTQKELYSNENNVWTDHEVYFDSEGNMKGAKKFVQNNETWEQIAEYEYNADNNVFELKKGGKVVSTVKYDEATEHWAEFDAEGKVVHEINKPEPVVESESASAGEETPVGENSETADAKPSKISMFDRLFHRNKVKLEKEVASGEKTIGDYKFNTVKDENGYVRTETDKKTNVVRQKEYFNAKGKKIKTEEYNAAGSLAKVTEGNVTTEYNADGTINNIDYPHNKNVEFTYDENGNLIGAEFYEWHNSLHPKNWWNDSEFSATKRCTYYEYNSDKKHFELKNEKGDVIGTATFDPKTRHWVEEGQYSSDLAPKTTNVSRGEGRFRIKLPERNKVPKNLRDENGNLREGVTQNDKGYIESITKEGVVTTKNYDSKGTLVSETTENLTTYYNKNGKVIYTEEKLPGDKGVKITEKTKDYDLEIIEKDGYLKIIHHTKNENGTAKGTEEFIYNKDKNVYENKGPEGTVFKTVEYDAKNHKWTIKDAEGKKIDSQNNMKESHIKRNIGIGAGVLALGGGIYGVSKLVKSDDDKEVKQPAKPTAKQTPKKTTPAPKAETKVTLGDKEGTIAEDGTLTLDGKPYPKDTDGTYTIGDKKYKVEDGKLVAVVDTPDDNGETGGAAPDESPEVKGTIDDKEYTIKDGKVSVDGAELTPDENGHYKIGDDKYKIEDGKLVKVEPEEPAKTDAGTDAAQSDDSQTGGGRTGGSASGTTGSQGGGRTGGSASGTTGTTHNDTSRPVTTRPSERREESRANSARHSEQREESRRTGNTPVTRVTEPTQAQKQVAKTLQDEISGISTQADEQAFFTKLTSALENGQITTLQSDELLNLVQVHGETLHEITRAQNEQDAIPEPEFGLGEVPTQQQPQRKEKREITPMERMELTESIRNARDRKDIVKIQQEMRQYKVFPGRKNLRRAYKAKLRAIKHQDEPNVQKYNEKFNKRMEKVSDDNIKVNNAEFMKQVSIDENLRKYRDFEA